MADVAISRLRLRTPSGTAASIRTRMEDAVRLAATEGERLFVLRRLDFGRVPAGARASFWTARAAALVQAQRARAVHATAAGAAAADAVWFHSAEEAQALLLLELASGRRPSAWFWRLAVPEWRGASLAGWLPRILGVAMGDGRAEVELARAFLLIVKAGQLGEFVEALALAPMPSLPPPARVARRQDQSASTFGAVEKSKAALARARRLMLRHDSTICQAVLEAITEARREGPKRVWLARLALVAAAPELSSQRAVLAETASALIESEISTPELFQREHSRLEEHQPVSQSGKTFRRKGIDFVGTSADAKLRVVKDERAAPLSKNRSPPDVFAEQALEDATAGAGTFLLVRPLGAMGFVSWLERHQAITAEGFGRALLRHIGARMRVPEDDPLFALLRGEDYAAWQLAITAWRVGLDRWLRRNVRRRLSDVVRRRGWISRPGEHVAVRFRVDAADVNLRRRALDIDPGWVPWLGCVVRYHYSDRPL